MAAPPTHSPGPIDPALGALAGDGDLEVVVAVLGLGDRVLGIGAGSEGVVALLQRDVVEADLALLTGRRESTVASVSSPSTASRTAKPPVSSLRRS